jgi:hypothetical protein
LLHIAQIFLNHTPTLLGHCEELVERERGIKKHCCAFFEKKLKVPLFVKDLIIPLHEANHWSVIVMNIYQLLHYDPLINHNCLPYVVVHRFFAKF